MLYNIRIGDDSFLTFLSFSWTTRKYPPRKTTFIINVAQIKNHIACLDEQMSVLIVYTSFLSIKASQCNNYIFLSNCQSIPVLFWLK